eukprot:11198744-Lingulodinium_polyedra.AAC.1
MRLLAARDPWRHFRPVIGSLHSWETARAHVARLDYCILHMLELRNLTLPIAGETLAPLTPCPPQHAPSLPH